MADEGSSGDMFSAIRGGVALKKVAALPDVKNLSVQEEVRPEHRCSSLADTHVTDEMLEWDRTPLPEPWRERCRAGDSRSEKRRKSRRRKTTASGTTDELEHVASLCLGGKIQASKPAQAESGISSHLLFLRALSILFLTFSM